MSYLNAEEVGARYNVNPRTPENWEKAGYIHAFLDQHRVVRYSADEIEAGFAKYGPKKMRDGRARRGRRLIPIAVPEATSPALPAKVVSVVEGGDAQ
jgi:hypothetical protein